MPRDRLMIRNLKYILAPFFIFGKELLQWDRG